jgi:hypothetical protein
MCAVNTINLSCNRLCLISLLSHGSGFQTSFFRRETLFIKYFHLPVQLPLSRSLLRYKINNCRAEIMMDIIEKYFFNNVQF